MAKPPARADNDVVTNLTADLGERGLAILRHLRTGPTTRSALASALELSRATVVESLRPLTSRGLVNVDAIAPSTGGRRARLIEIAHGAGYIGVIDIGGSRTRVGLVDLSGHLLAHRRLNEPVSAGPDVILPWATRNLQELFRAQGPAYLQAVVAGVPGPVDFESGRVVSPPIMSGWEDTDIKETLTASLNLPVIVDNDVNLIALAEHRISRPDSKVLLVIKFSTGIGGGLVIDGNVIRGARGAAGDIGHIQSVPPTESACRCGHIGCVEVHAAGWALVQQLCALGIDVVDVTDVARLAREGDPVVLNAVREAAQRVGHAAANAVSLLNPDTVIIAGGLLGAGEQVIALIREAVYQQSLPLATHDLVLAPSNLGPYVGLLGGGQLGADFLLGQPHPYASEAISA